MMNRNEFAAYFNSKDKLGGPKSPLWCPEGENVKCNWFVKVRPVKFGRPGGYTRSNFYAWNGAMLNGRILCYSSDDTNEEEWWGFTDKEDILMFILKWA